MAKVQGKFMFYHVSIPVLFPVGCVSDMMLIMG